MRSIALCLVLSVALVGCRSTQPQAYDTSDAGLTDIIDDPVAPPRPGVALPDPRTLASSDSILGDAASAPNAGIDEDSVSADDLGIVASDVNETRLDVDDLGVRYARTERKLGLLATQVEQLDGKVSAVENRVGTLENAPASAPVANPPRPTGTKQSTLQRLVRWWQAKSPVADSCLRQIRRDNPGATKAGILALLRTECTDPAFMIWAGDRIPADQGQQEGSANP